MAIYKLGLDCVLTVGGSQVKDAKDVTLNVERGDADVTTRNNQGWRAHMGTLKDASIEFQLLTGGDTFDDLLSMFTGRTAAAVVVSGGNISFSATMVVTNFSASQPLEDAESVSVTLKPSLGTTPTFSCATASTSSGSGTGS
jgi:hypothetical protein